MSCHGASASPPVVHRATAQAGRAGPMRPNADVPAAACVRPILVTPLSPSPRSNDSVPPGYGHCSPCWGRAVLMQRRLRCRPAAISSRGIRRGIRAQVPRPPAVCRCGSPPHNPRFRRSGLPGPRQRRRVPGLDLHGVPRPHKKSGRDDPVSARTEREPATVGGPEVSFQDQQLSSRAGHPKVRPRRHLAARVK